MKQYLQYVAQEFKQPYTTYRDMVFCTHGLCLGILLGGCVAMLIVILL